MPRQFDPFLNSTHPAERRSTVRQILLVSVVRLLITVIATTLIAWWIGLSILSTVISAVIVIILLNVFLAWDALRADQNRPTSV